MIKTLIKTTWIYSVIPEKAYHIDIGEYDTYGIQVTGPQGIWILHDVSVYESEAIRMTELFNQEQLSDIHLQDVVEDMLV